MQGFRLQLCDLRLLAQAAPHGGGHPLYGQRRPQHQRFSGAVHSHSPCCRQPSLLCFWSLQGCIWLSADSVQARSPAVQFFVTLAPTPWLDGKHTIFGRVYNGMGTVQRLGNIQTGAPARTTLSTASRTFSFWAPVREQQSSGYAAEDRRHALQTQTTGRQRPSRFCLLHLCSAGHLVRWLLPKLRCTRSLQDICYRTACPVCLNHE